MRVLNDYEKGFLEAAIDGEGSIHFCRKERNTWREGHNYQVMIRVHNSNPRWLQKIKDICGNGNIIQLRFKKEQYRDDLSLYHLKPMYRYQIPAKVLREILPQLDLVIKREKQKLILEAIKIQSRHGFERGIACTVEDAFEMYSKLEELYKKFKEVKD